MRRIAAGNCVRQLVDARRLGARMHVVRSELPDRPFLLDVSEANFFAGDWLISWPLLF